MYDRVRNRRLIRLILASTAILLLLFLYLSPLKFPQSIPKLINLEINFVKEGEITSERPQNEEIDNCDSEVPHPHRLSPSPFEKLKVQVDSATKALLEAALEGSALEPESTTEELQEWVELQEPSEEQLIARRYYANSEEMERVDQFVEVTVPPRTKRNYEVGWKEKWELGKIVITMGGETREIGYKLLVSLQLDSITYEDSPCGEVTPGTTISATVTPFPIETPYPTGEPALETTDNIGISNDAKLGEIDVDYPNRMSPGSSSEVEARIYIIEQLVASTPVVFERIDSPIAEPSTPGQSNSRRSLQGTIWVEENMRVELDSFVFRIKDEISPVREVDLSSNKTMLWVWSVQAPDEPGFHRLTIKVYLNEDDSPAWMRYLEIEVIEATPTPLPPVQRIGIQLPGSFPNILIALITLTGVLVGVYGTIKSAEIAADRQQTIERLEQEIESLAEEADAQHEELSREIQHLKSIKWWQVWRR